MKTEDMGPLYRRIGDMIVADSENPAATILYYVAYDDGVITSTLAEDRGDHIFYPAIPRDLAYAVMDAWEAQDGPDKWVEMSYLIENGQFHATLFYADMIDPAEDEFDRPGRVIAEVLGQKPARSDPLPPTSDGGYTFEL